MKGVITRPSGLEFRIIQNGYGKRPQPTDTVKVYYTGKMINGVIFDGTSPGLPASFKLTSGLIQGWIEALLLMREGDHWQLVIPPNLGYGVRGSQDGSIPPNQTLIFDLKTTTIIRCGFFTFQLNFNTLRLISFLSYSPQMDLWTVCNPLL